MSRVCTCGTRLSRYNTGELCSVCEPKQTTHAAYTSRHDPARIIVHASGPDACPKGHDLLTHGTYRNAGGGRITRRCLECERKRKQRYALAKKQEVSA